jgi:hypothetical protein
MKFSGADIGNVKDLIVATFSVDEFVGTGAPLS